MYSSYPLMWGGSFLIVLSLFMLSLARPNQFYQVRASYRIGSWIYVHRSSSPMEWRME
jgi:hypothetical protein